MNSFILFALIFLGQLAPASPTLPLPPTPDKFVSAPCSFATTISALATEEAKEKAPVLRAARRAEAAAYRQVEPLFAPGQVHRVASAAAGYCFYRVPALAAAAAVAARAAEYATPVNKQKLTALCCSCAAPGPCLVSAPPACAGETCKS